MHLSYIPQYTIQNRNVHISVLNGALWDIEQVHFEICEKGPFHLPLKAHGPADDHSVLDIEALVAHCTPLAIIEDLNPALVYTTNQTDVVVDRNHWINTNTLCYQYLLTAWPWDMY